MIGRRPPPPADPANPKPDGTCTVHVVRPGDTCYGIATSCGIKVEGLQNVNPGMECTALWVGQRLCCSMGVLPNMSPSITPAITTTMKTITTASTTTTATTSKRLTTTRIVATPTPVPDTTVDTTVVDVQISLREFENFVTCSDEIVSQQERLSYGRAFNGSLTLGSLDNCLTFTRPGVAQLRKCNAESLQSQIWSVRPGGLIKDTLPPPAYACAELATITAGSTCLLTAKSRGLTLESFLKLNPGLDCSNIDADLFVEKYVSVDVAHRLATAELLKNIVLHLVKEARVLASVSGLTSTRELNAVSLHLEIKSAHWELAAPNPVADDRSPTGQYQPQDKANYLQMVSTCHSVFRRRGLLLTMAIPTSYWYLRGFDIKGLNAVVDWFNLVSYDIHGTWDANIRDLGPMVQPHTNVEEIHDAILLLQKAGAERSKIVMGLGFYARTFTLADRSCTAMFCPFVAGGRAGECTQTRGSLSYREIDRIQKSGNYNTQYLTNNIMAALLTYDDQWIGFDDPKTIQQKVLWAGNQCLGGVMVWSVDQDVPGSFPLANAMSGTIAVEANIAKTNDEETTAMLLSTKAFVLSNV
ncbi:hypothetical protein HDV05_006016 [Chytridiales sp. JEL 0842]|nr:hypothetical protein HDV05_006016 [Chytridiales sp. JEL 0842]